MAPAVMVNAASAALRILPLGDLGGQLAVQRLQVMAIDHLRSAIKIFTEAPSLLHQTEELFHSTLKHNDGKQRVLTENIVLESSMAAYELAVGPYLTPAAQVWLESAARRKYRCHLEDIDVTPLVKHQEFGWFDELLHSSCELNLNDEKSRDGDSMLRERFQELMKATIATAFLDGFSVGGLISWVEKQIFFNQFNLRGRVRIGSSKRASANPEVLATLYLRLSQETYDKNSSEIHRDACALLKEAWQTIHERKPRRMGSP
jgi:hypothetical protein